MGWGCVIYCEEGVLLCMMNVYPSGLMDKASPS